MKKKLAELDRSVFSDIERSLRFFPITLIQGARQVGKSFLLKKLLKEKKIKEMRSLDNLRELKQAQEYPHEYIQSLPKPVAIDEIQRVPELTLALKYYVDEHQKKGDFVVTGSANIFSYPASLESLAGRMNIINVNPLSISEIHSNAPCDIFHVALKYQTIPTQYLENHFSSFSIWDEIFWGGFPQVTIERNYDFKNDWCASYLASYIERDLRDLTKDTVSFYKFFEYISVSTGQQIVLNSISRDVGLDQRTLKRYIEILEMTYQIDIVQPYYSNHLKRLIKTPKVFFKDTGLLTYLMGIENRLQLEQSPYKGAILETWLYNEITKNIYDKRIQLNYFRQNDGAELDFILSQGQSHVLIECKTTLPTNVSSIKGIQAFRQICPNAPVLIFHTGHQFSQIGPNIYGVPFSVLIGPLNRKIES